jgi:hypothetical protein
MGLTKTDYRLKLTPEKSEVLLRNGLGKIVVAKTTAKLDPFVRIGGE